MQARKRAKILFFLLVISAARPANFSQAAPAAAPREFDISKVRQAAGLRTAITDTGSVKLPKTPSLGAIAVRTVLSLGLILFLLAGSLYVFRRVAYKGRSGVSKSGMLDVLETSGVVPGKSLSLVRIADRVLLLGISQEGIRCLSEFQGQTALDIIQASDKGNLPKPMSQFSDSLNLFLERFKGKGE